MDARKKEDWIRVFEAIGRVETRGLQIVGYPVTDDWKIRRVLEGISYQLGTGFHGEPALDDAFSIPLPTRRRLSYLFLFICTVSRLNSRG